MLQSNKTYKIINVTGGTALTVSVSDNKSVVGDNWQASDNQKWRVDEANGAWTVRNIGTGLYLGIEGVAKDEVRTTTVAECFQWHMKADSADPSTNRLFIPNTDYYLDLYYGDPAPGTPVIIWTKLSVYQTWRFEEE